MPTPSAGSLKRLLWRVEDLNCIEVERKQILKIVDWTTEFKWSKRCVKPEVLEVPKDVEKAKGAMVSREFSPLFNTVAFHTQL